MDHIGFEAEQSSTALRSQIDSTRAATVAAERKVSEADSALSAAVSAVRKEKETSDALAATRLAEIDKLQTEAVEAATNISEKTRIGLGWKKRHDEMRVEHGNITARIMEEKGKEISEVNGKLLESEKELKGVKTKLGEVEKRLEEIKKVEEGKDAAVKRLQGELATLRSTSVAPIANAADKSVLVSYHYLHIAETHG